MKDARLSSCQVTNPVRMSSALWLQPGDESSTLEPLLSGKDVDDRAQCGLEIAVGEAKCFENCIAILVAELCRR